MLCPAPPFTTRFAPSPNGRLHLGHAYSALVGQHFAGGKKSQRDGQFFLRIEDIDLGRRREKFITAIYEDLQWLGIDWDGEVLHQSQRFDIYTAALQKLREMDIVYPCWATRQDIRNHIETTSGGMRHWPIDPDGAPIYPGLYRDTPADTHNRLMWEERDHAWRLNMQKAHALAEQKNKTALTFTELSTGAKIKIDPTLYGDVVIARKDIPTSYHLSVVVDDAAQNINLVVRGMDLQPATHIHRILQVLLDLPEPAYFHHALIRNEAGRRLSKQAGDAGFADWRQMGATPQNVLAVLPPMPEIAK